MTTPINPDDPALAPLRDLNINSLLRDARYILKKRRPKRAPTATTSTNLPPPAPKK